MPLGPADPSPSTPVPDSSPLTQPTARLALRLETGERRGETVPIPEAGLTVGRRPENDLVLADPSVSGRHAALKWDRGQVWLEDLGSTNGTKLAGRSVGRTELAEGDRVLFGSVECTVVAAGAAEPTPARVPAAAPAGAFSGDGDELELELEGADAEPVPARAMPAARVAPARAQAPVPARSAGGAPRPDARAASAPPDADLEAAAGGGVVELSDADLARATRGGGRSAIIGLGLLVLAAGAGAAWFLTREDGEDGAGPRLPTADLSGSLLGAAGQFEGTNPFEGVEGSPLALELDRVFAATGEYGLGLAGALPGEWAGARSAPVTLRAGQVAEAKADVRVEGSHRLRLGLEFSSSTDAAPTLALLGPPAEAGGSATLALSVPVPADYDRVRLLVHADGGVARAGSTSDEVGDGLAALDDAQVRAAANSAPPLVLALADWRLVQTAPDELLLLRFDRVLGRLRLVGGGTPLGDGARFFSTALRTDERGLDIQYDGAGDGARLEFAAAPSLFQKGVATLASAEQGGFRTHAPRFERDGVEGLLLGEGLEQMRLALPGAIALAANPEDGWWIARAGPIPRQGSIELQLAFQAERVEARRLAELARGLADDPKALETWRELLARFPFEAELVREAEAALTAAQAAALSDLRALEADAMRARFFRLDPLLARVERGARELAARAGGGQAAERAESLAESLAAERETLRGDGNRDRRAALQAMGAYFERAELEGLRSRVGAVLDREPSPSGDSQ
ncbi:MAG: FHA domain-containing protein [Planctomycetaceae bacterium]|nr:FHA domain-containing protein [Planctomycetaceae bacterium]